MSTGSVHQTPDDEHHLRRHQICVVHGARAIETFPDFAPNQRTAKIHRGSDLGVLHWRLATERNDLVEQVPQAVKHLELVRSSLAGDLGDVALANAGGALQVEILPNIVEHNVVVDGRDGSNLHVDGCLDSDKMLLPLNVVRLSEIDIGLVRNLESF